MWHKLAWGAQGWKMQFWQCVTVLLSSSAFLTPAIFFVPNFHVVHFQSPRSAPRPPLDKLALNATA